MLLKLKYATVAAGWVLTRLQAQAFSVVGFQKLSNPTLGTTAGLPSSTSTSPSTPRTLATVAWRPPSGGVLPLHMSTGGDAVESSLGTTSEQRSVLDALIDQFTSPQSGNVTATVEEYLDLCDHAFLTHLRRRIEAEEPQSPKVRPSGNMRLSPSAFGVVRCLNGKFGKSSPVASRRLSLLRAVYKHTCTRYDPSPLVSVLASIASLLVRMVHRVRD